ncbi:MAG: SatD family protein [Candidatus Acetothermia bacterium]
MDEVAIIVGDLVFPGRSINERDIRDQLESALQGFNEEYEDLMIAPMEIVRHVSFAGGFTDASAPFEAFIALERKLFPVGVRAGIGVGRLSTPVRDSITVMDGRGFHRARAAIEEARRVESHLTVNTPYDDRDEMINTILSLLGVIKDGWTPRQWEVAGYYQSHEGITQTEIADVFGISQPAVAKILSRAKVKKVETTNRVIRNHLRNMLDHR